MADTSSTQALPAGHLQSPLFKLMPTEMRLEIYRHTFAGSQIHLKLDPGFLNPRQCRALYDKPRPGPLPLGGRRSVFCSGGHYLKLWQVLFTCKQIYDEALAIYWSETIVCNGAGYFSRGLFFERILDFAKLHVKHLRQVKTSLNPGVESLRGNPSTRQAPFAEALDAFPKLQSCSIEDEKRGTKPSKAVKDAIVRHPGVHFLKIWPESAHYDSRHWEFLKDGIYDRTYMDFTTGMKHTVAFKLWDWPVLVKTHEEGFQYVMELQPSDGVGGNGGA